MEGQKLKCLPNLISLCVRVLSITHPLTQLILTPRCVLIAVYSIPISIVIHHFLVILQVVSVDNRKVTRPPPLPFTTSTFIQEVRVSATHVYMWMPAVISLELFCRVTHIHYYQEFYPLNLDYFVQTNIWCLFFLTDISFTWYDIEGRNVICAAIV